MLKSLFGGSAVLLIALLLSSLTYYAQTSSTIKRKPATDQDSQTQTTINSKASNILHESPSLPVAVEGSVQTVGGISVEPEAETKADAPAPSPDRETSIKPDTQDVALAPMQKFTATAYALPGRTASGHGVRRGLIAADRSLPLGTRVRLNAGSYSGEYTVADRGSRVRGRIIDIWVPSNSEAMRFGRRPVKLTILSYGVKKPAKRAVKTH